MGAKSKLTPHQWVEIEEKLLNGESQDSVAKEYGVTRRYLAKTIVPKVRSIQEVANKVVEAKKAMDVLPVAARVNAQTLIDRLMAISDHLSSAAEYSARNAHKFSQLANQQLEQIDPENVLQKPDVLRVVNGLTTMANESAKIPLGLIQASKEQMQRINEPDAEQVKTLNDFYSDQSDS